MRRTGAVRNAAAFLAFRHSRACPAPETLQCRPAPPTRLGRLFRV